MSEPNPRKPLTHLCFHFGNRCSLTCHQCQRSSQLSSNGNGREKKQLPSPEIISQAIHEAMPLGLESVRLCGEDPFLYPAIGAILDDIERRELRLTIETS